jgi:hypothetical protein
MEIGSFLESSVSLHDYARSIYHLKGGMEEVLKPSQDALVGGTKSNRFWGVATKDIYRCFAFKLSDPNIAFLTYVNRFLVQVPFAGAGCAFFQFHKLCEMPLGAADFFELFSKYSLFTYATYAM